MKQLLNATAVSKKPQCTKVLVQRYTYYLLAEIIIGSFHLLRNSNKYDKTLKVVATGMLIMQISNMGSVVHNYVCLLWCSNKMERIVEGEGEEGQERFRDEFATL